VTRINNIAAFLTFFGAYRASRPLLFQTLLEADYN